MTIKVWIIKEIDKYIRTASGGARKVFAKKLGISPATLSRHIRYMKERGAPIEFDRTAGRHYYTETGYFLVDIRFVNGKPVEKHKKEALSLKK